MEGFKYEKIVTFIGIGVGILSSILLINLTIQQTKFHKAKEKKYEEKNGVEV